MSGLQQLNLICSLFIEFKIIYVVSWKNTYSPLANLFQIDTTLEDYDYFQSKSRTRHATSTELNKPYSPHISNLRRKFHSAFSKELLLCGRNFYVDDPVIWNQRCVAVT